MRLRVACVVCIATALLAGGSRSSAQEEAGGGYTIKQVRLSNDSPVTQHLMLDVTLASAEGIEIPLGELDAKAILRSAKVSPLDEVAATLGVAQADDNSLDVFRVDFATADADSLDRRLEEFKLSKLKLKASVLDAEQPWRVGVLTAYTDDTITLDDQTLSRKHVRFLAPAGQAKGKPVRSIRLHPRTGKAPEEPIKATLEFTVPAELWSIRYNLEMPAGVVHYAATITNSTPLDWSEVALELTKGNAKYVAEKVTLDAGATQLISLRTAEALPEPKAAQLGTPVLDCNDSNLRPFTALELVSAASASFMWLPGPVSVYYSEPGKERALVAHLDSLPDPDDRLKRPQEEVRLIKLRPLETATATKERPRTIRYEATQFQRNLADVAQLHIVPITVRTQAPLLVLGPRKDGETLLNPQIKVTGSTERIEFQRSSSSTTKDNVHLLPSAELDSLADRSDNRFQEALDRTAMYRRWQEKLRADIQTANNSLTAVNSELSRVPSTSYERLQELRARRDALVAEHDALRLEYEDSKLRLDKFLQTVSIP